MGNRKNNTPGKGKNLKAVTAIALAVCVVINILVGILPASLRRVEVSKDNLYSVSEETKLFLDSLNGETVAYVVDADGSDRRFEYFMEEIGSCSEKLKVKFVKSDSEVIQNVIAKSGIAAEKITPYSVVTIGKNGEQYMVRSYEDMMRYSIDSSIQTTLCNLLYLYDSSLYNLVYQIQYNGQVTIEGYRICAQIIDAYIANDAENASSYQSVKDALLNNSIRVFCGEEFVCRMAEYVNVDNFPARYYVTGHGEKDFYKTEFGYNMALFCYNFSNSYYDVLDTTKLDTLPEDAVALVILDPKSDFSESEAQMFIDFVKAGGDITLITSNDCLSMPNVMSVAKEFGLSAENGLITEEVEIKESLEEEPDDDTSGANGQDEVQGPEQIPEEDIEDDESTKTYISDTVEVTPNTNHNSMAFLSDISASEIYPSVKNANSIIYENVDPKNVTLSPLLTTSDKVMLDGIKTERALATAVVADYITTGGMLAWFTGAESYAYDVIARTTEGNYDTQNLDADQLEELNMKIINIYAVLGMAYLSPTSYDSFVPKTLPPKPFANDVLNVTDKSFVAYTLIMIVLVIGVASLGAGIYYTRKKK